MSRPVDPIFATIFSPEVTRTQQHALQIVEAAIESYATVGIEETTFEQLSKKCKVTRPLIHHYFKNKRALFEMSVKYIRVLFQKLAIEGIEKETEPLLQLDAYFNATFDAVKNYPNHTYVWHLFYYYCGVDKTFRKMNTEFVNLGHDRIKALLDKAVKQGDLPKMDTRTRAKAVQVFMTGALNTAATENLYVPFATFKKQMIEEFRALLRR